MSTARPTLTRRSSTRDRRIDTKKENDKTPDKINGLLLADSISLEHTMRVKDTIKVASKAWLHHFLKMDGLQNLVSMLVKFQSMDDKEPNELRIQYELLLSVKAAMNSQAGLDMMIDQPDLVASLALNIDSEDSAICTQTLELLAVLMVSGDNGCRAVLEALDFFKLVTRERVRFQCLVDALHSNGTSFAFKRDIILFLNTVVNTATDLEDRLEIRADMIYSGIIPTVEKLKALCFDELGKDFEEDYDQEATQQMEEVQELEAQLQVFETVMQRDIAECVTDLETTFQSTEVDLSDPEQIFQSLHASSVEHECFIPFLSVLQTLLMIPSYDSFGKMQWETVDSVLKKLVAGEAIAANEEYAPEFLISNTKQNLSWKQRLEELSQQADQLGARCQEMEEAELVMKDELEELRRKESAMLFMREKERKAAEVVTRQLRHMQDLREFEKGLVSRAEEILVTGQQQQQDTHARRLSSASGKNSSRRPSMLKGVVPVGKTVGPVARPVMRIQGSRNLLNCPSDEEYDDEYESYQEHDKEGEEFEEGQSPADAETPSESSGTAGGMRRGPRAGGRGFGRGMPMRHMPPRHPQSIPEQPETVVSTTEKEGEEEDMSVGNEPGDTGTQEVGELKAEGNGDEGQPLTVSAVDVGALQEAARASLQRADSKEVEFVQMKRRLFDLEVRLQEAQRELQRQQDLARDKETEYKRKLKQGETTPSQDPRETIISLLQKRGSTPGKQVGEGDAVSTPVAEPPSKSGTGAASSETVEGTQGGVAGKLGAGGLSNLNALFGGVKASTPPPSKQVAESPSSGEPKRRLSFKQPIEEDGKRRAVNDRGPPPQAPPLPPGAMQLLMSLEAGKPGGIPLAPPMPHESAGHAAEEKKDEHAKPKKEVVEPSVPMRSLFWNKIPDRAIFKTVWEHLSDEEVKLDIQKLESLFCKAVVKPQDDSDKKDSSQAKPEKPKEVALLDTKVQQNVGIALVKYRMPSHEIRKAIMRMDEKKLDLEKLNSLRALAPTADDISALREYDGDVENLGRVEKFFMQIIDIPRYTQRLDCFIFMRKFQNLVSEAYCQHDILNRAIDQVENSQSLRRVLEIVLAIGNYLNGGTPRGGVYGFKLDGLQKLSTVKSVDNKLSLMHFVSMHCEETDAGILAIEEELSVTEEAARIGLDTCRSEIASLRKNLKNIEEQIAAQQEDDIKDPNDKFIEKVLPFRNEATVEVERLEAEYASMTQRFSQLAESFGEDGKKTTTEEFFTLIKDFVAGFVKAHRDNEKRRIMQEKAEMKRAAEEKKKKLRAERKAAAASDIETLVDDVFGNLKGKKADEIVDSLKVSATHTSRRKKSHSRRIGAGRRQKHIGAAEVPVEEDDALAAMMSKLGVDSSANGSKKKRSSKIAVPEVEGADAVSPESAAAIPLSSEVVLALANDMIKDSPPPASASGTAKVALSKKPSSKKSLEDGPRSRTSASRRSDGGGVGRASQAPAEDSELAAFLNRKKEGSERKLSGGGRRNVKL